MAASAAPREPRKCVVCPTRFTPFRSDQVYCSGACKKTAYRYRTLGVRPMDQARKG